MVIPNATHRESHPGLPVPAHHHGPVLDAVATYQVGAPVKSMGLADILAVMRRHAFRIGLACVLGILIGIGLAIVIGPSYRAEGLLVVETQEFAIPELQAVRSARTVEPWGGRSEAKILTSRALIERTVRDLELHFDDRFNPSLRPTVLDFLRRADWLPMGIRRGLAVFAPEPRVDDRMISEIVTDISRQLSATSEERSYAITLAYTSEDPDMAARVVNTLMNLYVRQDIDSKRATVERAADRLQSRVEQLRIELEQHQKEVRNLEARSDLVESGGGSFSSQELAAIATELRTIAAQRAAVERDLEQIDLAVADANSGTTGRPSVLNNALVSPRLGSLWAGEAALERRIAESSGELGPLHPQMAAMRDELASTKRDIAREFASIRATVSREAVLLRAREALLERQLGDAENTAAETAEGRAMLSHLRTEAESARALYDLYRTRYEQTIANLDLFAPDARVVSIATPPEKPSSPGKGMLGVVGGLIGLLAAAGYLIGRDTMQGVVRTPEEASSATGLRALGGIPEVGGIFDLPRRDRQLADMVVDQPWSIVAETTRGVLYRLQTIPAKAPKVVLVTSPQPKDGKSSLTAALARTAAEDGMRCLVIECDFRRPHPGEDLRTRAQAHARRLHGGPGRDRGCDAEGSAQPSACAAGSSHIPLLEKVSREQEAPAPRLGRAPSL